MKNILKMLIILAAMGLSSQVQGTKQTIAQIDIAMEQFDKENEIANLALERGPRSQKAYLLRVRLADDRRRAIKKARYDYDLKKANAVVIPEDDQSTTSEQLSDPDLDFEQEKLKRQKRKFIPSFRVGMRLMCGRLAAVMAAATRCYSATSLLQMVVKIAIYAQPITGLAPGPS